MWGLRDHPPTRGNGRGPTSLSPPQPESVTLYHQLRVERLSRAWPSSLTWIPPPGHQLGRLQHAAQRPLWCGLALSSPCHDCESCRCHRCIVGDGLTRRVAECPTPSESTVAQAIKQAVTGYKRVFGTRLAQVWLFGSRAVGEHRPDSDVDLLVVLRTEGNLLTDLNLLHSVAKPLRRTAGVFIDAHPTTLQDVEAGDDDFHYFIRREGRRVDV